MNIKKVNAGVWIKASDELPEDKRNVDGSPILLVFRTHVSDKYYPYKTMTANQAKDFFKPGCVDTDIWEWLKPVEGYVLTEDELLEIKVENYQRGYTKGISDSDRATFINQ